MYKKNNRVAAFFCLSGEEMPIKYNIFARKMGKRKIILRILSVLIVLIGVASAVVYFVLRPEKEWMAFYVLCCGGVLIVNLILMMIFAAKNIRK